MPKDAIIFPVFLPHGGCRERCVFCNQRATTREVPSPASVRGFIESSLKGLPHRRKEDERQVAFYGGSFTAMERADQIRYLREARPFLSLGVIDSIRISTRPDSLGEEALSLLREYGVKTVEIGAQSMDNHVLSLSGRGHRAEDTLQAISILKRWNFEVGIHLMIGLSGDNLDCFIQTLDRVIETRPDFVRIHPTLVLKGAPLETLWREGDYFPLSLNEAIQWLQKGLLRLERSSIRVARIGLQPTRELENHLLAGPYHPALHQLVDSEIFLDMAVHLLQFHPEGANVHLFCHPKEISNLRGQRNGNIIRLRDRFGPREIFIHGKEGLPKGTLVLETREGELSVQRRDFSQDGGMG